MSVRAERANASPVFFYFQEFSYLAARLVPRGASPPEGSVREKCPRGRRSTPGKCVYLKWLSRVNTPPFPQEIRPILKNPRRFPALLFVCMRPANGVNPRRRCILRRESYGRRAGPRRDPAARGSVRPIPDHTSAAGPAAGTRVESIRTFLANPPPAAGRNGPKPNLLRSLYHHMPAPEN